eukprot:669136-Prymnesium_polylepis.1
MPTPSLRRFDDMRGYRLPRWNVLWIEGKLDCRTWTYYCDIRGAMAAMHRVVRQREAVVSANGACKYNESEFDLVVVGPRYAGYVFRDSEPLGISRAQLAKVPLIVLQNKMYESHGEYTGDVRSKLQWAANLGAAAAFTWIGASAAHNFSRRSGVAHHWMPFGVNQQLYGSFAGNFSHQVCTPRKSCHECSPRLASQTQEPSSARAPDQASCGAVAAFRHWLHGLERTQVPASDGDHARAASDATSHIFWLVGSAQFGQRWERVVVAPLAERL